MAEFRIKELEAIANRQILSGLQAAAEKLVEMHKEDVSVPVVRNAKGRVVVRSAVNEFPRLESGQGQQNIDYAIDADNQEAAAGFLVEEAGTRVEGSRHKKAGGEHMAILRNSMSRYGIDKTLRENMAEIVSAFGRGLK